MIRISVVIPTYNRRSILARTLPLLLHQNFPRDQYEVIVVNDGSTDSTAEFLQSIAATDARLKICSTPQRGAGVARNAGIAAAAGELILFLDDDLLCPLDLLANHSNAHQDESAKVVHGPIYVAEGSSRSIIRLVTEQFYESYYRPLDPAMSLTYPEPIGNSLSVLSSLVNSSMRRQVLLECDGFDEHIRAAEDLELGIRLWKAGCTFRFLPAAAVEEQYVKTTRQYLRGQARATALGDLRASRKHPEYRPHSSLSGIGRTAGIKRLVLRALVCSPLSIVPLLALPFRLENTLHGLQAWRRLGTRLFRVAERITRLRTARKEAGSWAALQREFGMRCPVLLYHHVGPVREGMYESLNVSAKKFQKQMRWLARNGYHAIAPAEWLAWLDTGRALPRKPVIITFDDAYSDIAQYALPVLRAHSFHAAVYVVTQRTGLTNTWDEVNGSGTLHLMPWSQIAEFAGEGIDFGGHTQTHASLPSLGPSECRSEVHGSFADLASELGTPPVSFAYPYGEYDESVVASVRKEYPMAFSTVEGMNFLNDDRHLLRRTYIGPRLTMPGFALNVRTGRNLRWFDDLRISLALGTRVRRLLGTKPTAQ